MFLPGTRFPNFLVLSLLVLISDSSKRCELCDEVKISLTETNCEKCLNQLNKWDKEAFKEDIVKIDYEDESNDVFSGLSLEDSLAKRCELCDEVKISLKEKYCKNCLSSMNKWDKEDAAKIHDNQSPGKIIFSLTGQNPSHISGFQTRRLKKFCQLCQLCGKNQIFFKEEYGQQYCHNCITKQHCEKDITQEPLSKADYSRCIMCQRQIPFDAVACEECTLEQVVHYNEVMNRPHQDANMDDNDEVREAHGDIDFDDEVYSDNVLNKGPLRRKPSDKELDNEEFNNKK